MQKTATPRHLHFLLLPILYYAAAKISQLTVMPEGIAILWLPNSILLATFICFRGRGLVYFSILALGAEILADLPIFTFTEALTFGLANLSEATIAYALLIRWRFNPRFETSRDLVKFILAGPVISAFISACCGAWVYRLYGLETPYFEYLRIWWFGDALGLLILTPAILSVAAHGMSMMQITQFPHRAGELAVLMTLAALMVLIASTGDKLWGMSIGPTLLLPFVLFAASRLPMHWVASLIVVIAFGLIGIMVAGQTPFGTISMSAAVVRAQEFILVMSLMAMGLASLLTQLRARQEEIAALNIGLEQRIRERTQDLEQALSEVRQLQGLLPICISCKRIRDDNDHWQKLEKYISERTEARFSHGFCPGCLSAQIQRT